MNMQTLCNKLLETPLAGFSMDEKTRAGSRLEKTR